MKAVQASTGFGRGKNLAKRLAMVVAMIATTVLAIPATTALAAGGIVTVTTYGVQATPLNGVTVGIFNSSNVLQATCVTSGAGTCTAALAFNGTYTAKVVTAATGYNAISNVWLGTNSGGNGSTPAYTKSFTISNGNAAVWLMSRANNVAFPDRCELKVALVIDTSGSTDGSQPAYKAAAHNFVTALTGTPSSIGVWSFSVGGVNQLGITSLSTPAGITSVNNAIDAIPAPSGGTNWDVGLNQVRGKGADLVVVITDGNPTLSSGISPIVSADQGNVDLADVEGGVWAANGVKVGLPTATPPVPGSSIVVLGIGSGFTSTTNIALISGPTAGTDFFTSDTVEGLNTLLNNIALKSCGGSITVQKQVAPIGSSTYTNAANWAFTPAITGAAGGAVTPTSGLTNANGQVNYVFKGGTWPKTVTVTETQQAGYALVPQAGANAMCTLSDGTALTSTNIANGVQLALNQQAIVNCLFKNKALTNDLSILKTAPATAVPGGPAISYPLTVTNSATSDPALTQVVTDTLPAGLTWAGYPTAGSPQNGWACAAPVGQVLTCTRGTALAAGASTNFTVTASVPVGYQGASSFTNCATVTDNLPGDSNDTSCAPTSVVRSVDIVITKTDGGATVNPGGAPITYTLTVDNLGPSDVKTGDVTTITDTLPAGMTWVAGSITGCTSPTIAAQTMTCTISSSVLKVVDPAVIITGQVTVPISEAAAAPKTYTNKAYASTPDDLPCAGAGCVPPCTGTTPAKAANNIACEDTPSNKLGTLTASKTVTGLTGDATTGTPWSFGFTLSGGTFTGTAAQPIAGKGNSTVGGASWTNLQPGATYTLTETTVAGFTPTMTCTGVTDTNPAAEIVTFVATAGQSVACTATNVAAPATIEVVKTTVGGVGPFDFTLAPASVTGLSTNVTTAGTAVSTGVKSGLIAGTSYTLSENSPGSSWTVGAFACTETLIGSQTATTVTIPFTARPGAAYKCAITNTKKGTITIVKDAAPDSATDFPFTGGLGAFTLDDDADPTRSNTKAVVDLAPGAYSVVETGVAGWSLTKLVCTDTTNTTVNLQTATASIVLDAGENVTCTFTNTATVPTLTIVKTTVGGEGLFTFDVANLTQPSGLVIATATKTGTSEPLNLLPAATYGVSERADAGWIAGALTCNVTLAGSGASTPVANPTSFVAQAGDAFVCSITNTKKAQINIVKNTTGGDGGPFLFTGTWPGVSGFTITTSTGTGSRQYTNVVPGTYTVTETDATAGYDLKSLQCVDPGDNGSSPSVATRQTTGTIDLDPGEIVTCVYSNSKKGSITIIKDAQPNQPDDFAFTAAAPLSNFTLDDDGDNANTLASLKTFPNITATEVQGTKFAVAETDTTGWTLASITCSNGSVVSVATGTATIAVGPGEAVVCTYVNTAKTGSVTVGKTTGGIDVNLAWAFAFSISPLPAVPAAQVTPKSIAGTGNGAGTTTASWSGLIAGQTYTIAEATAGGYNQSLSCTGITDTDGVADRSVTFVATAGLSLSCAATNIAKTAQVTITKNVTGVAVGYAWSFTFGISPALSGQPTPKTISGTGTGTGSTTAMWTSLVPGSVYTISEPLVAGWSQTLTCTGITDADGKVDASVTFTATPNLDLACAAANAAAPSTIEVVKTTTGGFGTFDFTVTPPAVTGLSATTTNVLNPASTGIKSGLVTGMSYTVAETNPGSSWTPGALTCTETPASGTPATVGATFTAKAGASYRCTVTNVKKATVIITKVSIGGSGTFAFTGTVPGSVTTPFTPSYTTVDLAPGTYTAVEAMGIASWDLTAVSCNDTNSTGSVATRTATIVAAAGETVTCTFTNTKRGSISIVKHALPKLADDFAFTSAKLGGFSLDDDGDTANTLSDTKSFVDLVPGTFVVSETATAGWVLTSLTCTDPTGDSTIAGPAATIALAAGENVVCTYTNTAAASQLSIDKTAVGGDGSFSFLLDGPVDTTLTATTVNGSGTTGVVALTPGATYTVSENDPAAIWTEGVLSCSVTHAGATAAVSSPTTFTVLVGDVFRCAITNTKRGTIVVTKATEGGTGTFAFTGSVSGSISTTTADGSPSGTPLSLDVVPGPTYSVAEVAQAGWDLTSATCSDGSPISAIAVAAGEVVTCSFTNTRRGTIIVVKNVEGDNGTFHFGGTWSNATAFDITTSGSAGSGTGVSQFDGIVPGTYTVQELDLPSDYAGRLLCSDSAAGGTASTVDGLTGTIALDPGETVTCTFTNSQLGSIVVDKVTVPAADTSTEFGFTLTGSPDFTLVNTGPSHSSGLLPAGTYSVSEKDHDGWVLQDLSCTSADGSTVSIDAATARIQLVAGDTVRCTYTNRQLVADVEIVKTVDNAAPTPGQSFVWTLSIINNGPDDAHSVVISDQVPSSVTVNSVASTDFSCIAIESAITCVRDLLPAGAGGFVTVVVTVPADAPGQTIENTARVTSVTPDPDLTNNTSVSEVRVIATLVAPPVPPLEPPAVDAPLPETGTNVQLLVTLAAELLLAGGLLVLVQRRVRRRRA